MKGRPDPRVPAGPLRWSFRKYLVAVHSSPFGHKFELRNEAGQLVAFCKAKRGADLFVFHTDEAAGEELFRLEPKKARLFSLAYGAVEPRTGKPFAELRMKEYKTVGKTEWFMYNAEGDQIGMAVEGPPPASLMRRMLGVKGASGRAWQVHWGQQVCGSIQPQASLLGDRLVLNLELDKKDETDRRLALALTVVIGAQLHRGRRAEA